MSPIISQSPPPPYPGQLNEAEYAPLFVATLLYLGSKGVTDPYPGVSPLHTSALPPPPAPRTAARPTVAATALASHPTLVLLSRRRWPSGGRCSTSGRAPRSVT